jgi:hypothetical protein
MLCIGNYYHPDGTIYQLFAADYVRHTWVSNLCYLDPVAKQYYSPRVDNIAKYGRDHDGQRRDELWWSKYITATHSSFVHMH